MYNVPTLYGECVVEGCSVLAWKLGCDAVVIGVFRVMKGRQKLRPPSFHSLLIKIDPSSLPDLDNAPHQLCHSSRYNTPQLYNHTAIYQSSSQTVPHSSSR